MPLIFLLPTTTSRLHTHTHSLSLNHCSTHVAKVLQSVMDRFFSLFFFWKMKHGVAKMKWMSRQYCHDIIADSKKKRDTDVLTYPPPIGTGAVAATVRSPWYASSMMLFPPVARGSSCPKSICASAFVVIMCHRNRARQQLGRAECDRERH